MFDSLDYVDHSMSAPIMLLLGPSFIVALTIVIPYWLDRQIIWSRNYSIFFDHPLAWSSRNQVIPVWPTSWRTIYIGWASHSILRISLLYSASSVNRLMCLNIWKDDSVLRPLSRDIHNSEVRFIRSTSCATHTHTKTVGIRGFHFSGPVTWNSTYWNCFEIIGFTTYRWLRTLMTFVHCMCICDVCINLRR